jgi:dolichol-phosphate mannosyltransferase
LLLSLIIPIYNEEEAFPFPLVALQKVLAELPCGHEIIFGNDGSREGSLASLQRATREPGAKVLSLPRSFGHQAAITAGLHFASGDANREIPTVGFGNAGRQGCGIAADIRSDAVRGWASVVMLQCLFPGVTLFILGLVGDYVAKIFEESKARPLSRESR